MSSVFQADESNSSGRRSSSSRYVAVFPSLWGCDGQVQLCSAAFPVLVMDVKEGLHEEDELGAVGGQ